jgi:hypothetical protein
MNPMFVLFALGGAALLFAGSLLALEIGRRIGTRHLVVEKDKANVGLGTVEGAIFGLMGLLLAFTFSSSLTGFDLRRQLIVDEANAINTAYARLDVLPAEAQSTLRDLFRQYLSARVDVYRSPRGFSLRRNMTVFAPEPLELGERLQAVIWKEAVAKCPSGSSRAACVVLLPAITTMIEAARTRTAVNERHPPHIVFVMLLGLGIATSLLAGYNMAAKPSRSWLHILGIATALAGSLFVITNLEFPRLGLIRLDVYDHVLSDVGSRMQ